MSRFVHPGSARYGSLMDWSLVSESPGGYFKVKAFLEYVEGLLNKMIYIQEGVILSNLKLVSTKTEYILEIELFDRFLELLIRSSKYSSEEIVIENLIGEKLLIIKRLLISEGFKYFGTAVTVRFMFVGMQNISAEGLSRYIAYSLERGYNLNKILRVISKEFKDYASLKLYSKGNTLSHRSRAAFSDGIRLFKKVLISGRYLLGYRIDIVGRFSRKTRADKRTVYEGTVPLNTYKGYIDYGMSRAIMVYGASSVRVWFYYDRLSGAEGAERVDFVQKAGITKKYLCKVQ